MYAESQLSMRPTRHLAAAFALLTLGALAQTAQPKPELLLFHPSGPPLSYEVATIKPIVPNTADRMVKLPPGTFRSNSLSPLTIRRYIMDAYGAIYAAQVVGGPDWLNKNAYSIKTKIPDDLLPDFQKMKFTEVSDQMHSMQLSLLAERFHLKAHYETRILPVYELMPAKGGLKMYAVPAPSERKPGDPPVHIRSCDPLAPGSSETKLNSSGLRVFNGCAIRIQSLIRPISDDAGDRPIVDRSGVTVYFDVKDLTWAPLGDATAASTPDAPSLSAALEEKLGLKLVPAKDPIEVLVIDSIDRPTDN